jgi:hypothetical protein
MASASRPSLAIRIAPVLAALGLTLAAVTVSGCAPSALGTTRQQIAAGNYAAAHRELVALLANPQKLSSSEQREAKDDLCLTEFRIGPPAYPLPAQRMVCEAAVKEPGSQSGQILAEIEAAMRNEAANRVERALKHNDVVEAEDAALEYQALPGADTALMERWSRRMWQIVHQHIVKPHGATRAAVHRTVQKLRRRYKLAHRMTKQAFLHWVANEGTVNGNALFSGISLDGSRLQVSVRRSDLHAASLNLGRFTAVNDAMAARCGCEARTEVSIGETRFPLYVVVLDPQVQGSEALILPHP